MKILGMAFTGALLTLACTQKNILAATQGVETTQQDRGISCDAGQQKVLVDLDSADFTNPDTGISGYQRAINAKSMISFDICMNTDGQLTLKRVNSLQNPGETYPKIIKEYGWVDEAGPHQSLQNALYNSDYSQIEFRIQNFDNPSRSMFLKGHDGFVTLSYYDFNSNNPYASTDDYVYYGKLTVVDEGENKWENVSQTFSFETGYIKLKYKFLSLHTHNTYNFEAAEVLDSRYWGEVQKLNPTSDVVAQVTRHGMGDSITVKTLGATYELKRTGYVGNKAKVTLSVHYNNDQADKQFEYQCERGLTGCNRE